MYKILLIEDLQECQLVVKRAFANSSIHLCTAETVKQALEVLSKSEEKFDLIILDLGLPDGDGLMILEKIRIEFKLQTPIFLLTVRSDLDSKVTAFNLEADDYLIKPISPIELKARVEMRLKKNQSFTQSKELIKKGSLTLDTTLMRASIDQGSESKILPLTGKEFKILALLLKNEGQVYTRQDLLNSVWGNSVHILERTVDSHIFGLRKKLGDYAGLVECIPHVGYRYIQHDKRSSEQANERN